MRHGVEHFGSGISSDIIGLDSLVLNVQLGLWGAGTDAYRRDPRYLNAVSSHAAE